jgi:hypothetical protein
MRDRDERPDQAAGDGVDPVDFTVAQLAIARRHLLLGLRAVGSILQALGEDPMPPMSPRAGAPRVERDSFDDSDEPSDEREAADYHRERAEEDARRNPPEASGGHRGTEKRRRRKS